jgi:hypothetical protein
MIVKCRDGRYYINPRWHNKSTIVSATEVVEIWHKTKKPVKYRTLFKAANALGLCIGIHAKDGELGPVEGDMTKTVFALNGAAGKFVEAFHAGIFITSCPAPPTQHEGWLAERPADGDDDILDDFGIDAIKRRRDELHERYVG